MELSPALSVVIPTLGGESLAATIEQMNRGQLVPTEILICIPEAEAYRAEKLSFPNIRVVKTGCHGQVAQRAVGLKMARCPIVLQLDDDIVLPENTLRLLYEALLTFGPGNVVAPVYYLRSLDLPSHACSAGINGFINDLVVTLVCGAKWGIRRMGTVTSAGTCYGVDDRFCDITKPFATEWLPGGCLMSFQGDLVYDNFFPLPGKAFCEDLIHSHLRRTKGIKHFVIPSTRCYIDFCLPGNEVKAVRAQRVAQRYYVKLTKGSILRVRLFEMFFGIKRMLRQIWGCYGGIV